MLKCVISIVCVLMTINNVIADPHLLRKKLFLGGGIGVEQQPCINGCQAAVVPVFGFESGVNSGATGQTTTITKTVTKTETDGGQSLPGGFQKHLTSGSTYGGSTNIGFESSFNPEYLGQHTGTSQISSGSYQGTGSYHKQINPDYHVAMYGGQDGFVSGQPSLSSTKIVNTVTIEKDREGSHYHQELRPSLHPPPPPHPVVVSSPGYSHQGDMGFGIGFGAGVSSGVSKEVEHGGYGSNGGSTTITKTVTTVEKEHPGSHFQQTFRPPQPVVVGSPGYSHQGFGAGVSSGEIHSSSNGGSSTTITKTVTVEKGNSPPAVIVTPVAPSYSHSSGGLLTKGIGFGIGLGGGLSSGVSKESSYGGDTGLGFKVSKEINLFG